MVEPSPHSELEALTHALRRHAGRRRFLGERHLPRAPRPAEPEGTAPARESAAPAPAAPPGEWPSDWGTTPDPKEETHRPGEAIRARAAAARDLDALATELAGCNACSLCRSRTQTVFMDGRGPARLMFVGEAPGYHEDRQGVPFVGRAGQLLSDIIEKGIGLTRAQVVIANVLKCRPPENRDPLPVEKRLCTHWLDRQIELVNPEMLIALGRHAAGHLLGTDSPMGRLRGRTWQRAGRKVIATYHPAYLLRSPREKKACWEDIQLAMAEMGLSPPAPRRGSSRGAGGNPPGSGR